MSRKTKQPPDDYKDKTDDLISEDNLVMLYWNEVIKTPLLEPKQEIEVAQRIERGDELALEILITDNLRLVGWEAQKYRGIMPYFDLIQVGNEGLIRAARSFDYQRKTRFHARWWIMQAIKREINNHASIIRKPEKLVIKNNKIKRQEQYLEQLLKRKPSNEELAEFLQMDPRELYRFRLNFEEPIELDIPIILKDGEEVDLIDTISRKDLIEPTDWKVRLMQIVENESNNEKLDIFSELYRKLEKSHHKAVRLIHISVALVVDGLHILAEMDFYHCCKYLGTLKDDPVFVEEIEDIKNYARKWGDVIFVPCDDRPGWCELGNREEWSYQPELKYTWIEPKLYETPHAHTFSRHFYHNSRALSFEPEKYEPKKEYQVEVDVAKWWDTTATLHFVPPPPWPHNLVILAKMGITNTKRHHNGLKGYKIIWAYWRGWEPIDLFFYGQAGLTKGVYPKSIGDEMRRWEKICNTKQGENVNDTVGFL